MTWANYLGYCAGVFTISTCSNKLKPKLSEHSLLLYAL